MSDLQRLIKVIDWLVFERTVKNRRDLAVKIGYTESSLSQIINKKVPLSDKFIKKLVIIDKRLNPDWILTGEGSMIKNEETQKSGDMFNNEERIEMTATIKLMKEGIEYRDEIIKSLKEQLDAKNQVIELLMENRTGLNKQLNTGS